MITTNRKLDIQAAIETIQIIYDAFQSSYYTDVLTDNKYKDINTHITHAKNFIERIKGNIRRGILNGKNEDTYKKTLDDAKKIYTQLLNDKKRLDDDIGNFPLDLKTVSGPSGLFGNTKVNANETYFGGRRRHRTRKTRKTHKRSRK
jgi:hypothetical protein